MANPLMMALPAVPQSPAFARTSFAADGAGTTSTGGGRGALSYADALNAIIMSRLARPQAGPTMPSAPGGPGAPRLGAHRAVPRAGVKEAYDPLAALKQQAQRQAIISQMTQLADENSPLPQRPESRGQNVVTPGTVVDLPGLTLAQRKAYAESNPRGNLTS